MFQDMGDSERPFEGVRILDFTRYFAGPVGTFQLALLGADVIKVESIEGEDLRYDQLASKEWGDRGMSPGFLAVNGNKRSLAIDLRQSKGIEVVKRLAKNVDVVWENFRPGVMDQLGLGYTMLREANPGLIYCAVTGFGQTGPEKYTAAFDGKVQAMSGMMSLNGEPEQGPMRVGLPACDLIGGLTSAFAVSSALYQRTRTGRGQFVDVAMLDATLSALMAPNIVEYTVTGHVQKQYGNLSVSNKPTSDRFRCGDGYIMLAAVREKHFVNLMRILGREDVLDDSRFKDWSSRRKNARLLREIIETAMANSTPTIWEERLTKADVPCATIHTIDQIVAHPQLQRRNILQRVESRFGPLTLVGSGFELAYGTGRIKQPPPQLGEHTEKILIDAGYSLGDVGRLREAGIIL